MTIMIIGHKNIQARLKRNAEKDQVPQAMLFFGPESVGKYALAQEFARQIIGESGFGNTLITLQTPLDLLTLAPEMEETKGVVKERDIPVEVVREKQRELSFFPYAGKRRVLIIDNAHRLTESAQNALLKTLEDPASHAVTILVTHRLGQILPTVVSRCERIAFALVPEAVLRAETQAFFPGTPNDSFLFLLGRPGLLFQRKADPAGFSETETLLALVARLLDETLAERLALAERLSGTPRETLQILEWWLGGLHQGMLAAPSVPLQTRLTRHMNSLEETLSLLKRSSANSRLILENFFIGL